MKRGQLFGVAFIGLLSGCVCETIDCKVNYEEGNEIEGCYHVASFVVGPLKDDNAGEEITFAVTDDVCNRFASDEKRFGAVEDAIPIKVRIDPKCIPVNGAESATGLNVVSSALTLMIIPLHLPKEQWEFDVGIESPVGEDTVCYSVFVSEWGGSTPLGWIPALFSSAFVIEMGNSPTLEAERQREKRKKINLLAQKETVNAIKSVVSSSKYNDFIVKRRLAVEEARRKQKELELQRKEEAEDLRMREQAVVAKAEKERRVKAKEIASRDFALTEAPQLWKTVQMLKAEKASRKAALESLCKEMKDFGRDPEKDPDVAALRSAYADLDGSLATIYGKLEAAYIAYKKMQATPGQKEYADIVKAALEDGIQEADATAARYREMSRNK